MNGIFRRWWLCFWASEVTWVDVADTDVLYMNMMGSHLVFMSSTEAAADLGERHSDRVREPITPRFECLPAPLASPGFLW